MPIDRYYSDYKLNQHADDDSNLCHQYLHSFKPWLLPYWFNYV